MANVTVQAAIGSKRISGGRNIQPGGTADVSITYDNSKVKTKGDLLEACKALIDLTELK